MTRGKKIGLAIIRGVRYDERKCVRFFDKRAGEGERLSVAGGCEGRTRMKHKSVAQLGKDGYKGKRRVSSRQGCETLFDF